MRVRETDKREHQSLILPTYHSIALLVIVASQDHAHNVLPNIVYISFHCCQHNRTKKWILGGKGHGLQNVKGILLYCTESFKYLALPPTLSDPLQGAWGQGYTPLFSTYSHRPPHLCPQPSAEPGSPPSPSP